MKKKCMKFQTIIRKKPLILRRNLKFFTNGLEVGEQGAAISEAGLRSGAGYGLEGPREHNLKKIFHKT